MIMTVKVRRSGSLEIRMTRPLFSLAAVLGLIACSSPSPGGGGTPDGSTHSGICDGTNGIRLAARVVGGGLAVAGTAMLSENGWRYLLVDGTCVAWVLREARVPVVRVPLSSSDERQLANALDLSSWESLQPAQGGCADAPGMVYQYGDRSLSGALCGVDANSAWGRLNDAALKQIADLGASGVPWAGDVRYLVIEESRPSDNRPAVAWPLALPIETIALSPEQSFTYRRGDSLKATGDDAAKLRALRPAAGDGGAANESVYDFTRVVNQSGTTYQVYVRDSIPFEGVEGLLGL